MTATSVPFVNQLPNIVVQLVLTLGFGIMGLFTILALLYYGDYNDPQTLIKVMVAIVIIILMIVGVWQGLFLI
jgi:hypothetical protein